MAYHFITDDGFLLVAVLFSRMMLPPINIIHDNTNEERKAFLQKEISEHQLEVIYWPAIFDAQIPFRGVSRAHKQIIRDAKEKNLPFVVVGEDDLHLTASGAYQYFIEHTPKDFDLYLASVYYGTIGKDYSIKDFAGLTLYICHSRFYDTFLSMKETNHLDRELGGKGKYVVCHPFTAIQHKGYSILKKKYKDYTRQLTGRRLYGM